MARLVFRYTGPRPAAAWDIRFRVAAIGVFSVAALACPPLGLAPLAAGLGALFAWARIGAREGARVVASLAGFFVFFVGVGVLFTPTWEQLAFLGVQSARLLLLFLASHVLLVTATPFTVIAGIQWFLGFLGPRRAYQGASMAGWALASVPGLLDKAKDVGDAAALRGLAVHRRPATWMRLVTLGLLVQVVETAAAQAEALEARGFGLAVPAPALAARPRDAVLAALWIGWCVVWMMVA